MKNWQKILSIVFILILTVISNGCKKNEFYPASDIQITGVEPNSILPSSDDFSSISDGVITMKLLNSIPCELVSYDLSYKTILNEPIDSLTVQDITTNIPLAEKDAEVSVTLKPYTQQLLNLLKNSSSNISPVRATVTLHFKDVNKNETLREAYFLLYKFDNDSSSE